MQIIINEHYLLAAKVNYSMFYNLQQINLPISTSFDRLKICKKTVIGDVIYYNLKIILFENRKYTTKSDQNQNMSARVCFS